MDFSKYDGIAEKAEEGVPMHLRDPAGEPQFEADGTTPVTITLRGRDSRLVRETLQKMAKMSLRQQAAGLATDEVTAAERNAVEVLAAATVAWSDSITLEGKPLPCTVENARLLYSRYRWLREQVEAFASNRVHFMGNSSRGS